jgi:para-nitrobenzyl esterase
VALALLTGCGSEKAERPVASQETVRTVTGGQVIGFAEEGVDKWRGIPFAASTEGDNRWRAPRPVPGWSGVREAIDAAPRCPQLTNAFDKNYGLEPGIVVGSEDCLKLDVTAPDNTSEGGLPVMVWIHGGSNIWGFADQFDMTRFVANEKVVVVSVQYRLGPLGWFAHQALREDAQVPDDAAASFAILDLVAALKWVQANIAAFGGDPANVTLFGQSSGGHNIAALLVSPKADSLFHKAIIESGFFDSISLADAEGVSGDEENSAMHIEAEFGAGTADALRAVPLEKLFAAYKPDNGFYYMPVVISDGVALPVTPVRDALNSQASFNAVPLIIGNNRDEMKLFLPFDEKLATKRFWLFPVARDQAVYDLTAEYLTRLWRIRSLDQPIASMDRAGGNKVYAYRFDWDDGGSLLFTDTQKLFGAAHSFDIPFVLNEFLLFGVKNDTLFSSDTADDRDHLSRAMGRYWSSFARTGIPHAEGSPDWPAFTAEQPRFLRFDTPNDDGITVEEGMDDYETLVDELVADSRLDDTQRCHIVAHLAIWNFTRPLYKEIKRRTGC